MLSRTVTDVTEGMWRAACRLTVREGAVEVEDVAPVDFFLDPVPGPNGVVRFETKGSPIAGDFKVVPLGLQPA